MGKNTISAVKEQLLLEYGAQSPKFTGNYRQKLMKTLSADLDFHEYSSSYASHNFHSFPAKFPPQLPRQFITELTAPGDAVLDPMAGSAPQFWKLSWPVAKASVSISTTLPSRFPKSKPRQ